MTVRECMERIDAREFAGWVAFHSAEPFGEEREDLRLGILAATMANPHRKPGAPPFTPKDFMPDFSPKEPQTLEQLEAALDRAMEANRGR